MTPRCWVIAALLSVAGAAHAEDKPDASQSARAHFQAGLQNAEQGDVLTALNEFQAAYAIRPNFSVLYNIGQALSTLGRPLEAQAAFERYLAEGGPQIPEVRRRAVEALITSTRKRIGTLRIVTPTGVDARVWLDGREISREQLTKSLPLAIGAHSVVAISGGNAVESRQVTVERDQPALLELKLKPPEPHPTLGIAQLAVHCDVPGVQVELGGGKSVVTPRPIPLLVPAGPTTIRFSRPGYPIVSRTLPLTPGSVASIDCALQPLPALPAILRAELVVQTSPSDAQLVVDGQRFAGGPLPAGPHNLRVERDGFIANERTVTLLAGAATSYQITLNPTPALRARQERDRARRRFTGGVLGAVGAGLLGAAAGVYAWNSHRYDRWQADSAGASESERAASIQRGDDAALGLAVGGAGLLVGGAWVFLSSP
jgi:hypothetical protein